MFYHLNNDLEIFSDVPATTFIIICLILIYNLQLPSISKTFLLLTQDRTNPSRLYHTTRFIISTSNVNVTGLISTFDQKNP